MSSAHVSLVTCGIFPCEPNLDWRVTISKFWGFRPRVILSSSCSLRWAQILSCSDDFPWTQPILKGESFKFRLQGSTQMHMMTCCASFQPFHLTDCILYKNIKTKSWLLLFAWGNNAGYQRLLVERLVEIKKVVELKSIFAFAILFTGMSMDAD